MTCVVWDLDGTLLLADRSIDYQDPHDVFEACRLCPRLAELFRAQTEDDETIGPYIVTGRTPVLQGVTELQLDMAELWIFPEQLHLQPEWTGYAAMAHWKAGRLEQLGAHVYVGDHRADQVAAEMAGCRFIHADTLRLLAGPTSSASQER